MKVAVLGATGMLGSMVLDYLSCQPDLEVFATARNCSGSPSNWRELDVRDRLSYLYTLNTLVHDCEWLINCIGVIRQNIDSHNDESVLNAVEVNAVWPHKLARFLLGNGCRVLTIESDCVFSGKTGGYTESSVPDPTDVYGTTKLLGEVLSPKVTHLRCSIVGPELNGSKCLMGWLLSQPRNAIVSGYANHLWNGVTTLHFAKLCHGVIMNSLTQRRVQHVVPADSVSKAKLLQLMAGAFDRRDITVNPTNMQFPVDRRLATDNSEHNALLWKCAGYSEPPTIADMVLELGEYIKSKKGVHC